MPIEFTKVDLNNTQATPTEVVEQPIEQPQEVVENVATEETTNATSTEVVEQPQQTQPEDDPYTINFDMDMPEEVAKQPQTVGQQDTPQNNPIDYQKYADEKKAEILKGWGLDWADEADEFTKEFTQFRKNGGNPEEYLKAKSIDYNQSSDEDMIKRDLAKQFPTLSKEDLDYYYENEYKVGELFSEEEQRMGAIKRQIQGSTLRNAAIEEQKKFQIPAAPEKQVQLQRDDVIKEMQSEYQKKVEDANTQLREHPYMKSLMESKKVAIDLGEGKKFNFGVANPALIDKFLTDNEFALKTQLDAEGKPDMEKAGVTALINLIGVKKFVQSLINYGKTQTTVENLEEGRNIAPVRPMGAPKDERIRFRPVSNY